MLDACRRMPAPRVCEEFEARFGTEMRPHQAYQFMESHGISKRAYSGHASKPIGCESVNSAGYTRVKVAPKKWVPKQSLVWERTRGMRLPDGFVVLFCNKDRADFSPANLKAVPRARLSQINKIGYFDRPSLETALLAALVRHAMAQVYRTPRTCCVCGREFVPDYGGVTRNANAISCPECRESRCNTARYRSYGTASCPRCGAVFEKSSSSHVYCGSCSAWIRRERNRRYRGAKSS